MFETNSARLLLLAWSTITVAPPLAAQNTLDSWETWESEDPNFSTPGEAIEGEGNEAARVTKEKVGQSLAITARSDTSDAAYGPIPSRVQVESGVSGETVKLTIGSSVSSWDDFQDLNYSVSFTAPFDKDKERGSFITQTGLPDAYAVEFALSGSFIAPTEQSTGFAGPDIQNLLNLGRPARSKCFADETIPQAGRRKACNALSFRALIQKYGEEDVKKTVADRFARIAKDLAEQSYLGWQIAGSVGREELDHRDPVTLAKIDDDKTVFSVSSSITYVPRLDRPFAYVAGAELERDFELPRAETRCPADAGESPTVTCFTSSFGPPVRDTASTVFASVRYTDINGALPIGGELRLAVDPESGDWGAEVPIYFLRSADGTLNGGVRLAYDSDEDDGFVGLFVGTNFKGL